MPATAFLPVVLSLLAAPAVAPPPKPAVITQPDWIVRPTGQDLMQLYPKGAVAKRLEGEAVLRCRVDAEGALTDCQATEENPPGEGFGAAALAMSSHFRMKPMTRDGAPVAGGYVNIPIRFRLPSAEPLTLETALECYGAVSANHLKLTNGEDADIGWRNAVRALAAREHLAPGEVDSQLAAAREFASTPGAEERARVQINRCRSIRVNGALDALGAPTAPPP